MQTTLGRVLAGALIVSSAACSENLTSSALNDSNLTAREARTLAYGVTALGTSSIEAGWEGSSFSTSTSSTDLSSTLSAHLGGGGGKGGGKGGGPGGPGGSWGIWGPRGLGIHGTTTTTIERSTTCPQGGTTSSVTKITSVVDTVARTGKVDTESTETPAQCAFTVDSLNATLTTIANPGTVITITAAPSLVTKTSSSYSWAAPGDGTARGRGRATRGPTTGTQTGSFTYSTNDGRNGSCVVDLTTDFDPAERTHSVTGTFCGQTVNITGTLPTRGGGHRR